MYSTQEIISTPAYQRLSNEQKTMFLQTFGNRSDITPEMFGQFVQASGGNKGTSSNSGNNSNLMKAGLPIAMAGGAGYLLNQAKDTAKDTAKTEATKQGINAILGSGGTGTAVNAGATTAGNTGANTAFGNSIFANQSAGITNPLASSGTTAGSTGTIGGGTLTSSAMLPALALAVGSYAGNKYLDSDKRLGKHGTIGHLASDALTGFGPRVINVVLGKDDSKYGRLTAGLMTGGLSEVPRMFFGSKTKNAEANSLKEAIKRGDISEQDAQGYMENAKKFGRGGREGINVEQNYQDRLASDGQLEADRFKQYSQLVKDGKDVEANKLLRGKDIMGYSNVMGAISDATGSKYGTYDSQKREILAQAIADYNREKEGSIYGDKGTLKVKLDDILKQRLADIAKTGKYTTNQQSYQSKPIVNKPTTVNPQANNAVEEEKKRLQQILKGAKNGQR